MNDLLVSAVCYVSLVVLTSPPAKRHLTVFWRELWEIAAQARALSSWVGVSLLVGTGWLTVVDHWMWGRIDLPIRRDGRIMQLPAQSCRAHVHPRSACGPGPCP